jgi:hypothetical protein
MPPAITFSEGIAKLTIVVANNTTQERMLAVKYVGSGGGEPGLEAEAMATGDGLELVAVAGQRVGAHDATALRLEFHRVGEEPALDGAVVITAGPGVVAVPVSETKPAAATGFEQKSASITTTAWLGPLSRLCRVAHGDNCPDDLYQSNSTTVAARGVTAHETLIGGASGENARVGIDATTSGGTKPRRAAQTPGLSSPTVRPAQAPTLAKITAVEIPNPGSYTGDVAADPAATTPKTIAVTVHARDAIIWPLLMLGLGLWLSWFLTKRRETTRIGQGLRVALQEAVDPYLERRGEREAPRPDRDYLDGLLVLVGDALAPREQQYPNPKSVRERPVRELPRLYWDTYMIGDADTRASVTTRVATMVSRFERWVRLDDAFATLERAAQALPRAAAIYGDAQSILDLAQGEPIDDDETEARVGAMTAFAAICELYRQVSESFDAAANRLGKGWADAHKQLKASTIYDAASPADTPEKVAALRLDLLRSRRLLVDPENAPIDETLDIRPYLRTATRDLAGETLDIVEALGGTGVFAGLLGPLRHRFESAVDIRRSVREWDRIVFGAIAFLTALAYTLGFWSGKDWGSLFDYAAAFVAGATVPTVINWALLPSSRPLTSTAEVDRA